MSQGSTSPRNEETEKDSCETDTSDTHKEQSKMPQAFFSLSSHKHHNDVGENLTTKRSMEETKPSASAAFVSE